MKSIKKIAALAGAVMMLGATTITSFAAPSCYIAYGCLSGTGQTTNCFFNSSSLGNCTLESNPNTCSLDINSILSMFGNNGFSNCR